jgi:hypothetical protein
VAIEVQIEGEVGSFAFNNGRVENMAPYSLCGERSGDHVACEFNDSYVTVEAHTQTSLHPIVIEAEAMGSANNLKVKSNVAGFEGSGFIVFQRSLGASDPNHNYQAGSEVSYPIKITKAGD